MSSRAAQRNIVYCLVLCNVMCLFLAEAFARSEIIIEDRSRARIAGDTDFESGPVTGNILNIHFFPGLLDYMNGNYRSAWNQMNYMIKNSIFYRQHPRYGEILSYAHYIRGMIYLYHAQGAKRFVRGRLDFERAIHNNPNHYQSYVELSRLLVLVELKDQARHVLQRLLAKNPPEDVVQQVNNEIRALQSGLSKSPPPQESLQTFNASK